MQRLVIVKFNIDSFKRFIAILFKSLIVFILIVSIRTIIVCGIDKIEHEIRIDRMKTYYNLKDEYRINIKNNRRYTPTGFTRIDFAAQPMYYHSETFLS